MKFNQLFAAGALVSGATAFWRMECIGRVGIARIDPMVNPGEVAQHVHSIHGSSGFSETATYEDLVNADCTSCAVDQDKSAYWHPSLYFQHANGSYELVEQVGGMLAYYKLDIDGANPNGPITPFPPGFRMIAGDSLRRNYSVAGTDYKQPDPEKSAWRGLGQVSQLDLEQRALGFNCLNYQDEKKTEPSMYRHYMPDKDFLDANCATGLRLEIMFPSCWNGKDNDSKNHRSHVAYPDLVNIGDCPADFPVKMPGLFYEVIWNTAFFKGMPGQFVLSNGDTQGFGYHADFIMGWEEGVLEEAVKTCTNPSGRIQDCPVFNGHIHDADEQVQCQLARLPKVLMKEQVTGLVGDSLPGGVNIQYGPEPATNANPGPRTTTVAVPSVPFSPVPSSSAYPAGVFRESRSSDDVPAASATPAPEPSASIESAPTVESAALPVETAPVDDSTVAAVAPAPTPEAPAAPAPDAAPTPSASPVVSIEVPGPKEVSAAADIPEPPAPTEAPTLPLDDHLPIVSTQFVTVGNIVSEVVWKQAVVYVTQSDDVTVTVTVQPTSSVQAVRRVRRRSGHVHRHHMHGARR